MASQNGVRQRKRIESTGSASEITLEALSSRTTRTLKRTRATPIWRARLRRRRRLRNSDAALPVLVPRPPCLAAGMSSLQT
jgi:hypothetical protein